MLYYMRKKQVYFQKCILDNKYTNNEESDHTYRDGDTIEIIFWPFSDAHAPLPGPRVFLMAPKCVVKCTPLMTF